jgi:hypothetical protein
MRKSPLLESLITGMCQVASTQRVESNITQARELSGVGMTVQAELHQTQPPRPELNTVILFASGAESIAQPYLY